jgi:squalene-associated FAD-dependent desaturase
MRVAIIGAGWAGMAAAVQATRDGHTVTVFEATRTLGGRARALASTLPDGREVTLDNGQHILIGAYTDCLQLMREVGVDPAAALERRPLTLQFPDGNGLRLPDSPWLPAPLDALVGIARARGWPLAARLGLLRTALRWQRAGFQCAAEVSVAQLCRELAPPVMQQLIEPLCVSALNTPAQRASAQVFLRVLQDALFGVAGGSHLLLPRTDLTALFPGAAAHWLQQRGGELRAGARITQLQPQGAQWQVDGQPFDAVLLATSASDAAKLLAESTSIAPESIADKLSVWCATAEALQFEAIATVYAWDADARLPAPMLALHGAPDAPAQFVFDRGQLDGPAGLLAFVVSASRLPRDELQAQVLRQAQTQLGLSLQPVQSVVEKRATFACTPGLQRPPQAIAPGVLACGDYVAGPYPATLEGAVRSGLQAVAQLPQAGH